MSTPTFDKLTAPTSGTRVTLGGDGKWNIPDDPIVVLIKGDGIGADVGGQPGITTCAVRVLDAAVKKCYGGSKCELRLVHQRLEKGWHLDCQLIRYDPK